MDYYPKRPVKSFQDLEVYQKTLAISVVVAKRIKESSKESVAQRLRASALELPLLIASAHSLRFGDLNRAIASLEEAMLMCNKIVVYLEQYRDLVKSEFENEFFEEQIKQLLLVRGKILRLEQSWRKYIKQDPSQV